MTQKKLSFTSCFIIFGAAAAIIVLALGKPSSNNVRLHTIFESIERGNPSPTAEQILRKVSPHRTLGPWARLYLGKIAEQESKFNAARKHYQKVESSSAASIEALLAILRLEVEQRAKHELSDFGQKIAKLERDLYRFARVDLLPELLYLKAKRSVQTGSLDVAVSQIRALRSSFPRSESAILARELQQAIVKQNALQLGANSSAFILEETNLLIREGEPEQALQYLQEAFSKTKKGTPVFYEVLQTEYKVLTKLARKLEANRLLEQLAKEGPIGVGDEALLKKAHAAWNQNLHEAALENLDQLSKRFPNSLLKADSDYVRARILEETKRYSESLAIYQSLSEAPVEVEKQLKYLKRRAWLYFLEKRFVEAGRTFERIANKAETAFLAEVENFKLNLEHEYFKGTPDAVQTGHLKNAIQFDEHRSHGIYWALVSLSQKGSEGDKISQTKQALTEKLRKLSNDFPGKLLQRFGK